MRIHTLVCHHSSASLSVYNIYTSGEFAFVCFGFVRRVVFPSKEYMFDILCFQTRTGKLGALT